jgi:hypothetical protein
MIKWLVRLGLAFVATRLAARYLHPEPEPEQTARNAPRARTERRRAAK